jgi:hypothetical protein
MHARLNTGKTFLWIDEAEHRSQQVRSGEIVIAPVVGHGAEHVPNGLIHHWIGAVFIPNATVHTLLAVIDDYDNYKTIYRPGVVESQLIGSNAVDQEFSMVWLSHVLFVNAAMLGRYRTHEFVVDAHRGYTVVDGTCIQQIDGYGHSAQHVLPPDTGAGFVWRIHSISRYEQRDGGVYLETEAIALSRDIPHSLRWMVAPAINRLSINSLKITLGQTREAVQMQRGTEARNGNTSHRRTD